MHENKIYTGIGSRETPADILNLMTRIGTILGQHGWTLRSGHAPGADQAFERGAVGAGKMEIYLPWDGFEEAKATSVEERTQQQYLVPSWHPNYREIERIAAQFHPAWEKCSQGARKLHSRNVCQVAGAELDTPSDMVICWTKDGRRAGGTGQALRIADHLKIPIFDLAIRTPEEILEFIIHGVVICPLCQLNPCLCHDPR